MRETNGAKSDFTLLKPMLSDAIDMLTNSYFLKISLNRLYKKLHKQKRGDAKNYDLILDVGELGNEGRVEMILKYKEIIDVKKNAWSMFGFGEDSAKRKRNKSG